MLVLQLAELAWAIQWQRGDLEAVGASQGSLTAQAQNRLTVTPLQQPEVLGLVAVSDDVADVVLQWLKGWKQLQQRLSVLQRGQGQVHGDKALSVYTGHAHGFLQHIKWWGR